MATVINPNATEDEPLRINLEGDEVPVEGGASPPAAATPVPVGIEELKKQLEESARTRQMMADANRRMQAERDHAQAVAAEAERRGVSAQEVVNETRLNAVQEQLNSLAENQKGAYEAGEWGKVAEINLQLNKLGGELALLERDRAYLQNHREQFFAQQQAIAQQRQQQPQQVPSDPFERALMGRTQRTQEFLRQHRDLIRPDGSLKRAAIEAHERALDDGHAVDTDAYFRKVEELLAGEAPRQRQNKDTAAPSAVRPKSAPSAAAPVSRSGIPGQSGSEFTMTPKMRQLAEEQGIPPAEWAENYIRLVREGRMEPIQ